MKTDGGEGRLSFGGRRGGCMDMMMGAVERCVL